MAVTTILKIIYLQEMMKAFRAVGALTQIQYVICPYVHVCGALY